MKDADYQKNVAARCSQDWHGDKVPTSELVYAIEQFIKWGNVLDRAKKSLFYGRDFFPANPAFNAGEHYQTLLDTHGDLTAKEQVLIHAILGHATESTELVEALRSRLAGLPFDPVNLQEEFGDGNWYRILGISELGQTNAENQAQNDAKLEKRFGPAFSAKKANERDLDGERTPLENKS